MADWFSSLANQAIQYADSIADSLVDQANQAQEQIASEQRKLQEENDRSQQRSGAVDKNALLMPWETTDESKAILSQALMEKILNLSIAEDNFTSVPPNADDVKAKEEWNFGDFVPVALRLLEIDTNLSRCHAKVSPKIKGGEEEFWFRYYSRVLYLRAASGIDGPLPQQNSLKWKEEEMIYTATATSDTETLFGGLQHLKRDAAADGSQFPADSPKESTRYIGKDSGPSIPQTAEPSADTTDKDKSKGNDPVSPDKAVEKEEGADDDDDDDLDLDDLDDLDLGDDDLDDDYENVDEEDDFELEAAIAKELAAAEDEDEE